ncbi:hypothetical protein [Kitasatospora sp. NPDC058218]|uniref:hypothetical protein n=1 Tax=Kitasatospora sp. NPDC058218 TaxID=3346385 RepID=UPI0036DBF6A6
MFRNASGRAASLPCVTTGSPASVSPTEAVIVIVVMVLAALLSLCGLPALGILDLLLLAGCVGVRLIMMLQAARTVLAVQG